MPKYVAERNEDDDDDEEYIPDEEEEYVPDDPDEDDTAPCPHCGDLVYDGAEQCPSCGQYISLEDEPRRGWAWWVILGFVLAGAVVFMWLW